MKPYRKQLNEYFEREICYFQKYFDEKINREKHCKILIQETLSESILLFEVFLISGSSEILIGMAKDSSKALATFAAYKQAAELIENSSLSAVIGNHNEKRFFDICSKISSKIHRVASNSELDSLGIDMVAIIDNKLHLFQIKSNFRYHVKNKFCFLNNKNHKIHCIVVNGKVSDAEIKAKIMKITHQEALNSSFT